MIGTAIVGCGNGNDMTKAEMDAAKHSKPPDPAKLAGIMQAGASAAKQKELDWMKAHPDKVAEVNAARARSGQPPLGQ